MGTKKSGLFICLLLFCVTTWASLPDLSRARMSLGGNVSILSKVELTAQYYLDILINPSISFIHNGTWEVGARPTLNFTLLRPFKVAHTVDWGLAGFFRKFFPVRDMYTIYAGGNLGVRIFDVNLKSFKGVVGVEGGILIGLNDYVAIDIGMPISAYFDGMSAFNRLEFPLGFWGLKAFF